MAVSQLIPTDPRTIYRIPIVLARIAILGPIAVMIVLNYGFRGSPVGQTALHALELALFVGYLAFSGWRLYQYENRLERIRTAWFEWLVILAAVIMIAVDLALGYVLAGWPWHLVEAAFVLMLMYQMLRLYVGLIHLYHMPHLTLPISFVLLITFGALLLKLPAAMLPGEHLGWVDSFFTATSAVCVTGLVVQDTSLFSTFGQIVILSLIQLGAFGIMIFASGFAMLLGKAPTLRESLAVGYAVGDQPLSQLGRMVKFIVVGTLIIEAIGALCLYGLWRNDEGQTLPVFDAIFHAISAFCNAGFSRNPTSLVAYRTHPATLSVVSTLIILGGLGFPVLMNLYEMIKDRCVRKWGGRGAPGCAPVRMTIQTKLVLLTSLVLLVGGAALLLVSQALPHFYASMGLGQTANAPAQEAVTLGTWGRLTMDATFQSVTARTAGFNSMPMDQLTSGSILILTVLMFIGGSPGSTAGGVKTMVITVLFLSVVATLRNRPRPEAFHRSIAEGVIRRAATLLLLFLTMVSLATLLLCLSEPMAVQWLLFEATSACATVGLSLGATAELSTFGRWVIIGCMFTGRVGPLTLMAALTASRARPASYHYPHEAVVLG